MKRLALAVTALCLLATSVAHAKRAMPAKTTICNKSKTKLYVATYSYAGVGTYASRGWTYIKPGACTDFHADYYHLRGKRTYTGLSNKTVKACITYAKRFYVHADRGARMAATCKRKKGRLVTFYRTRSSWQSKPTRVVVTK